MTLEALTIAVKSWGLAGLMGLFAVSVLYALWPANREKFERAGRAPLQEDEDGPA